MNACASDSVPLYNRLNPTKILYAKCYLFFYIVYLLLRNYRTSGYMDFFLLFVICSIYIQMKHSGFNSDVKCMEVRGLNLQYITEKKKKR